MTSRRSLTTAAALGVVTMLACTTAAIADTTSPQPAIVAGPDTTPATNPASTTSLGDLERIPWEGGPDYYAKFPAATRAGWTDPKHFPIAVWWGGDSTDAHLQADKALGINTYIVTNPDMDPALFSRNAMSYIGQGTRGMTRDDPAWVGDYLDDEIDGRFAPTEGLTLTKQLADKLPDHDKIRYANYTGMVISWHASNPTWNQAAKSYTNDFLDTMSLDTYWYSSAQCDWDNPNGHAYAVPFTKDTCRTPQNYGRSTAALRWRDTQDGKLTPIWNFIENVEVQADGKPVYEASPEEIKAAAISSVINEARGLVWFNQSFGGRCATGNALRAADDAAYPCRPMVLAMGEVNRQLHSIAPALNTQSYRWHLGPGVQTILKATSDAAYIIAMPTDVGDNAGPGTKTLTLPQALHNRPVEVVDENRTLTPAPDGTITDTFDKLTSYHIYKISLGEKAAAPAAGAAPTTTPTASIPGAASSDPASTPEPAASRSGRPVTTTPVETPVSSPETTISGALRPPA